MTIFLRYSLVLEKALDCLLHHFLLTLHLLEFYPLLLLGHTHEYVVSNEGQSDALITVASSSTHPVDI